MESFLEKILDALRGWPMLLVIVAFGGLVVTADPSKMWLMFYAIVKIAVGAYSGYWVDRVVFPYARPDSYLKRDHQLSVYETDNESEHNMVVNTWPTGEELLSKAALRRAVIIAACILGMLIIA